MFDSDLAALSRMRLEQARSPKIIIGGMTLRLECFYDEGECLAGKSTVIILPNAKFSLKDVSGLEREIDQLVYALYALSPEEIQIVEAAAK